ncbi:class I SAM-dependent methyltransferase [Streptomyces chrestomyceticus]|uniref:Methyltransferase domain-containing protein n=1 Tax=Streptomyces chrestomyceticus TaxID=68185 RepID=A0ABU7X7T8_9ACTN
MDTSPAAASDDDYGDARAAAWYAARDDRTDRLLGYPFVFRELELRERRGACLLDFGCGPGVVAEHTARRYAVRVLAADTAPAMLHHIRGRKIPHASVHRIREGRIAELPDHCADAAMCNHVLTAVPDQDTLARIFDEIRRLLRPGAPFAALTTDPGRVGIRYTCQQVGTAGGTYRPGDPLPLRLRYDDGSWREFHDFYWPPDIYPRLLKQAGFTDIHQHHPTVAEAAAAPETDARLLRSSPWTTERAAPPLLITAARA